MDLEFLRDTDSRDPPSLHIVPHRPFTARPIPHALTTLIGRDDQIDYVVALFRDETVRLATLTGTGGIGKTRVALEVARAPEGAYGDGVHFVSLAPVRSEMLVAPTIANQLGLPETAGFDATESLLEFLEHKHALLVLDNFEHVLDSAGLLATLLGRCSRLFILVTSRATLRISAEHEVRLLPLHVPASSSELSFDDKRSASALRLFADRAHSSHSDFTVDRSNIETVANICRKLDGLPLAIELAAARSKYLALPALLARLSDRLALLDKGFNDAPERQRSLKATIDWSYDWLTTEEQQTLRRLSVFAGSFGLEAVEAVAGPGPPSEQPDGEPGWSAFAILASLSDKSLLNADVRPSETRFSMHETIREYAWLKMSEAGEVEESRGKHAAHFLQLTRSHSSLLDGKDVARALTQLEIELANIRVALEWALASNDPETALSIAIALDSGWYYHGHLDEGRRYLKRALALEGASDRTRIDGMFAAAMLAALQADHVEAESLVASICESASAIGYALGAARAYLVLGASHEFKGDPARAESLFKAAETLLQDQGSPRWTANLIMLQADAASQQHHLDRAYDLATRALALSSEIGHTWTQAHTRGVMAFVHQQRGDTTAASRFLLDALVQFQEIGDIRGIAGTMAGTASVASAQGSPQLGVQLLGGAREMAVSIGVTYYTHHVHARSTSEHLRTVLGATAFDEAFQIGRSLPTDSLLQLVRVTLEGQLPKALDHIDRLAKRYHLTRRESEVYRLLANGRTNAQIADTLFMQPRTARTTSPTSLASSAYTLGGRQWHSSKRASTYRGFDPRIGASIASVSARSRKSPYSFFGHSRKSTDD